MSASASKKQRRQPDAPETSSKTLTSSGQGSAEDRTESAEKPVSLAPLGFEGALRGLLAVRPSKK